MCFVSYRIYKTFKNSKLLLCGLLLAGFSGHGEID